MKKTLIYLFYFILFFSCSLNEKEEYIKGILSPYFSAVSTGNVDEYTKYYSKSFINSTDLDDWNEILLSMNSEYGEITEIKFDVLSVTGVIAGKESGTRYIANYTIYRSDKIFDEKIILFQRKDEQKPLIDSHSIILRK